MAYEPAERGERRDRRVVVTGIAAISPLGLDIAATWEALLAGRSGVAKISLFDASEHAAKIAGEVPDWDPDAYFEKRESKHLDRTTQLGLAAGMDAFADSGFEINDSNAARVGALYGSGIGGVQTLADQIEVLDARGPRRVSPFLIPMMIPNAIPGQVAIKLGAKGPNTCIVTACAASGHAIGEATELIRRGRADAMIAGGAEASVCAIGVAGFSSMKALSTRNDEPERASRPFDAERDGFVVGEGAAALMLEERESAIDRGARIYAEVVGYGLSADAYHITAPSPEGDGAARAMAGAIEDAGALPSDVDYINAHGTSTPFNDTIETMAIKTALGDSAADLPISSTKSMTGHLLGAAGALEAVICVKAIEDGVVPPTINLENADPECDLDYVANEARSVDVSLALSNSFGFGGHNVCLAFGRV